MSYSYQTEKPKLLEPQNVGKLIKARDKILRLVKESGAISGGKAMCCSDFGDSWACMAVADWMVEQGDLYEIQQAKTPMGQYRIYIKAIEH